MSIYEPWFKYLHKNLTMRTLDSALLWQRRMWFWFHESMSWLCVRQIQVKIAGERGKKKLEGSSDVFLSGSEWTNINYSSTLTYVMSWFNSLGKQAYSSHVSINVNYSGSRLCLAVPLHCSVDLIAAARNPIC